MYLFFMDKRIIYSRFNFLSHLKIKIDTIIKTCMKSDKKVEWIIISIKKLTVINIYLES